MNTNDPVLTLGEAADLLRIHSTAGAAKWLKIYASDAILPPGGGRIRVSRARLLSIIENGTKESSDKEKSKSALQIVRLCRLADKKPGYGWASVGHAAEEFCMKYGDFTE